MPPSTIPDKGVRSLLMMSDSVLIQAHHAGDPEAITALMSRYQSALMGMLVNRVGTDAEDLYQEIWVRVSRNLDSYDDRGTFKAWLFQIARRLIIDHHRRRNARIQTLSIVDHQSDSIHSTHRPDQRLDAQELHEVFCAVLAELDAATAEVITMRLTQNQSFKAIAEHQNVPINTALGRMHRGLKRIRAALISAEILEDGGKK